MLARRRTCLRALASFIAITTAGAACAPLASTSSSSSPAAGATAIVSSSPSESPVIGRDWAEAQLVEQPAGGAQTTTPYVNPGSLGHPQHYQGGEADLLGVAGDGMGDRARLVAVGYLARDVTADAWHSIDGLRWTRVADFPAPHGSLATAVASGTPGFVAVGSSGRNAAVWESSDGIAWHVVDGGATFVADPEVHLTAVIAYGDGFLAGGYIGTLAGPIRAAMWRSADGRRWEPLPDDHAFADARIDGLAVLPGAATVVAVGRGGDAKSSSGAAAWSSTNGGTSWHRATLPADGAVMHAVVAGANAVVAVGTNGASTEAVTWTSTDGATWQVGPSAAALDNFGLKIEMRAVTWDGGRFVAGGHLLFGTQFPSAVIWTSPDGRTWTRARDVAAFSQGKVQAVSRGGPGLIASGNFGAPDFSIPTVWVSPPR
jgi:hypothetical protein